jgi:hypothetical protein
MSRKAAIIVLASLAVTIGLGVAINIIPFRHIDPDSMPSGLLQYKDQDNNVQEEALLLSGYNWEVKEPPSNGRAWVTVGPNNFFSLQHGVNEIQPSDFEVKLQIVWLEPPSNIVIKRWPLSERTPGDFDASHSEGLNIPGSWVTHLTKTDIEFDFASGSLYGIWVYYGDAWVEYSFIIPAEDPTSYDYLGYFSGFDNPNADQFTLDPAELIGLSDIERIEELNLNPDDDMPGGFYIYNPAKEAIPLRLTDQTNYSIIDPDTGNSQKTVDRSEFLNYLNQSPFFGEMTLFWVSESDGNVEFIKEQYVP